MENENKEVVIHRHEICEATFWLRLWCVVAVSILLIVALVVCHDAYIRKVAFQNGYEETMLPGAQSAHWTKVK